MEVAFQHNDGYTENIFTFVNNINTPRWRYPSGGLQIRSDQDHQRLRQKIGIIKDSDKKLSGDDVREGMTAVVSIKVGDPQFEGQTKAKLGTSEAKGAVEAVLSEYLTYFLEENPAVGKIIIEKGLMASRARDAARKARELVRRKTGLEIPVCPASSQTAPAATLTNAKSILSKGIPRAVLPSKPETPKHRLSCLCAVKF